MGKADVYAGDYLENPEIFADLLNGILYQGEQIVRAEELQEQDGELRSISERDVKKTIRDKVRLWRGTAFAVFAVENQMKVDYRMVIRAMLSEAMAYDKQWKKLREKRMSKEMQETDGEEKSRREREFGEGKVSGEKRKPQEGNLTSDEFISGMRKEDKFVPVITVIVYYGREKRWDGATTLYELLDAEGNEEVILPFVTNYRLNVFDYHDYEEFGQFRSELQSVFEFLRYSEDKRLLKEKLENNRERYEKLSNQTKALLAKLANIREIPGVTENDLRRGEFEMCKAFEDMKEEGRIEGIKEGIKEGMKETALKMLQRGKLSIEEIAEYSGFEIEEIERLACSQK